MKIMGNDNSSAMLYLIAFVLAMSQCSEHEKAYKTANNELASLKRSQIYVENKDVDGDGKNDYAVVNPNGKSELFLNRGDGLYNRVGEIYNPTTQPATKPSNLEIEVENH